MDKPLISIIVPVYNVGPYVEDCIRSVMRQTYDGKIECIVVDDCGTDDSMAIVDRLILEYNGPILFKVLHHEYNRGLSAARNTGMEAAIGDYLFFLDSDDELTNDCVKKLIEPLEKEWYDIVLGDLRTLGSDKLYSDLKLKLPNNTVLHGKDIINTYRVKWNIMAQNKLYRTGFIRQFHLSFLEGLVHEDELWSFQVAYLASSLYVVLESTYLYRIRFGGLSSLSKGERKVKNYSIILKEMGNFLKQRGGYNEHIHQIIQGFLYKVLSFSIHNYDQFIIDYKILRSYIKPSIIHLLIVNNVHPRRYLRDLHYLLPKRVAPRCYYYYIKYHTK